MYVLQNARSDYQHSYTRSLHVQYIFDLPPTHSLQRIFFQIVLLAKLLSAFAKLRKATISFVISFCPSVRREQIGCQRKDFHKIWYLSIFRKSAGKNEFY
jgi:hypothetical protein